MGRVRLVTIALAIAVLSSTGSFLAQTTAPPPPRHVAFSTYLGGSTPDPMKDVALDDEGRVYVVGETCGDPPTTPDAPRRHSVDCDGYFAILSPAGALIYATFVGGQWFDGLYGVELDAAGNIFLLGLTQSGDFPTTPGAYDRTCGSNGDCGPVGRTYDVFVMKLAPLGRSVVWSTFLGGGSQELMEAGGTFAVDPSGRVHVAGTTESVDFPVTSGALRSTYRGGVDAFYARLSADGARLDYSTFLSSSSDDWTRGLAVDHSGAAYIAGYTTGTDFTTVNAMNGANAGSSDGWLVKVDGAGSVVFSTYLGGAGGDIITDVATDGVSAYVTGETCSAGWPKAHAAFPCALYILKLPGGGQQFGRSLTSRPVLSPRIEVIANERVYLMGLSNSAYPFVSTPDAAQPFIAGEHDVAFGIFSLANTASDEAIYASHFGSEGTETPADFALDAQGNVAFTGITFSNTYPLVNAIDTQLGAFNGDSDGFVARLTVEGMAREDLPGEVVLYARDVETVVGQWELVRDVSAAGGSYLSSRDHGAAKITTPLASPADYVEFSFDADAGAYRLWIRGRALDDHWANDSVHVQFSDSVDSAGRPLWRIGTTSGTSVNLEDAANAGVLQWGWQDNGYGTGVLGPLVRFPTGGTHRIRVQVREDGFQFDQIVLSKSRFVNAAPGALKRDGTVLAPSESGGTPPPAPTDTEIVLYPVSDATLGGRWTRVVDASATGGHVLYADRGDPKINAPLATTTETIQMTFNARAGTPYRVWLRLRAQRDYWGNDSVWVQFSGSVNASNAPIYRIGTTQGTFINLEECANCGLAAWGWQDNGYGAPGLLGETIYFAQSGLQTIRIQPREDGVAIDQVVISAATYMNAAPGAAKNDTTVIAK